MKMIEDSIEHCMKELYENYEEVKMKTELKQLDHRNTQPA